MYTLALKYGAISAHTYIGHYISNLSTISQLFLFPVFQVPGAPKKELFGFQKVYLDPGQSTELYFVASAEVFHLVDKLVCIHNQSLHSHPCAHTHVHA